MWRTAVVLALAAPVAGCGFFGLPDDEDAPGPRVIVAAPEGLTTTEQGDTASFTVALGEPPGAEVRIRVSTSDAREGTASPETLTFTAADWNEPKSVTVRGVDDDENDGDVSFMVMLAPAESTGLYGGVDPPDVEVVNVDDDAAPTPPGAGAAVGITVTPTAGLRTTEAGATATFTIVLDAAPTADVTITLASNRPTEGIANVPSVTFTPADWDVPQTVTVIGVDDAIAGVDQPYIIVTGPAVSTDTRYSGLDPPDVRLMNEDDDEAGIVVTPTEGSVTTERGDAATIAVRLASQPTADVTVPLVSSRPDEGRVEPTSVTFTPLDWLVPQRVTVLGVDDDDRDGDQAYAVITGPAVSADPEYLGLDAPDAAVTNLDDEGGRGPR